MGDPTTLTMNLTFFGTLAIGLVLFLGVFLAFVITLLLAGGGRLIATAATALFQGRTSGPGTVRRKSANPAKTAVAAGPAGRAKPARKEPQLSPEWAAAVARADERASARAGAESAMDRNRTLASAPRAFANPPVPARSPIRDTGSLTMRQHQPGQRQDPQRKAS
ncbi:hypothetical protein [Arthrobacter sp. UYEF3]|uniref:hypothetical protein n=1 Tax=Arthrobacter sp. UYEF3 TaxID=1756365 RepID=UPI003390AFE0